MDDRHDGEGADGDTPFDAPANLTPARVTQWVDGAQPGARLCYHVGHFGREGAGELRDHLHRQSALGFLYLVQGKRRPDGRGREYLAIRSSRPAAVEAHASRAPTLHEQARAWAEGRRA
jgi:hypothetical protein